MHLTVTNTRVFGAQSLCTQSELFFFCYLMKKKKACVDNVSDHSEEDLDFLICVISSFMFELAEPRPVFPSKPLQSELDYRVLAHKC